MTETTLTTTPPPGRDSERRNELYGIRLSDREYQFLSGLRDGLPPAASAARAGYQEPAASARALLMREHIGNAVAYIQAEIADSLEVSRLSVFNMLDSAYKAAEKKADSGGMVRVCAELNKMCGYYHAQGGAPTMGGAGLEALTRAMLPSPLQGASDEEVAAMAGMLDG